MPMTRGADRSVSINLMSRSIQVPIASGTPFESLASDVTKLMKAASCWTCCFVPFGQRRDDKSGEFFLIRGFVA